MSRTGTGQPRSSTNSSRQGPDDSKRPDAGPPRGETATHWIIMGLHSNLDEAMKIAVRETIDFLTKRFPLLTREEAYMIASVAVDYHLTQVVDVTKGIHGMIPKAIFASQ